MAKLDCTYHLTELRIGSLVDVCSASRNVAKAKRLYEDVLGLEAILDLGWIVTYGNEAKMAVQLGVAETGGSGTMVPDLSIDVDDVDEALALMQDAGFAVEYGPIDEPWGVRRFYVRDPFGKLVNILAHW
ncbi:MAG: VOC family protein [Rhizobiales bacterium]|nr:VOC family protein [Hyphomicrobiales bacterium]